MNDLQKIYFLRQDKAKLTGGYYGGFVSDVMRALFVHITEETLPEDFNQEMPLVKFGANHVAMDLIGRLPDRNFYSDPRKVERIQNKQNFYAAISDYMPKTVFSCHDISELTFPVIVKPAKGQRGQGIWKASLPRHIVPRNRKRVFQNWIDIRSEYRCLMVNNKIVYLAERTPVNEKALALRSRRDRVRESQRMEKCKFRWSGSMIGSGMEEPFLTMVEDVMRRTGLKFAGLDVAVDTQDRPWIIEANTAPGLNDDQIVRLYRGVFEDFYGRSPDTETNAFLGAVGKHLVATREVMNVLA